MTYIKERLFPKEDGNGFFSILEGTEVEFINPIPYFKEWLYRPILSSYLSDLLDKHPEFPLELYSDRLFEMIAPDLENKFNELIETPIPKSLIGLLKSTTKKEQVQLLKGSNFNTLQLLAFIIKAWNDFGFSFSSYKSEYYPKGFDRTKLPNFGVLKGNEVETVGSTVLSDGQVKNVIQQRKVVASKFLDKDSSWHCFFVTYNSLKGEENWKNGQPHFHYISDKFGIKRDTVVAELKSGHYNLGSLPHIELLDDMINVERINTTKTL